MSELTHDLAQRLAELRAAGLSRMLRRVDSPQSSRIQVNGRSLLNFSSNDYLGLAHHPDLQEAAIRAVRQFGAGSGASRLICGSLAPHHALEQNLASFKGAEAALTFSSGYATALGTITALMSKDDVIVLDRLVHACVVDAARLSGAKLRVFAHNDLNDLERILQWTSKRLGAASVVGSRSRVLVVTESVFSMDGDQAPLTALVDLKDRYGAWLMVDEAHATGLYGPNGSGLVAAHGLTGRIEVQMGTLGKALGASGGFIAGSSVLVEYLVNRARSFIFSTAPVPAAVAAATEGIRLSQNESGNQRRDHLWGLVARARAGLSHGQADQVAASAIIPVLIGNEQKAVDRAEDLLARGLFVPAIRYPTVARNEARLRVTLTAAHEFEEVDKLVGALQSELREPVSPSCEL